MLQCQQRLHLFHFILYTTPWKIGMDIQYRLAGCFKGYVCFNVRLCLYMFMGCLRMHEINLSKVESLIKTSATRGVRNHRPVHCRFVATSKTSGLFIKPVWIQSFGESSLGGTAVVPPKQIDCPRVTPKQVPGCCKAIVKRELIFLPLFGFSWCPGSAAKESESTGMQATAKIRRDPLVI